MFVYQYARLSGAHWQNVCSTKWASKKSSETEIEHDSNEPKSWHTTKYFIYFHSERTLFINITLWDTHITKRFSSYTYDNKFMNWCSENCLLIFVHSWKKSCFKRSIQGKLKAMIKMKQNLLILLLTDRYKQSKFVGSFSFICLYFDYFQTKHVRSQLFCFVGGKKIFRKHVFLFKFVFIDLQWYCWNAKIIIFEMFKHSSLSD